MIDLINRDHLMGVFREKTWRQGDDGWLVLEHNVWDDKTGRAHVEWIIVDPDGKRITHSHNERIYTLQELELRLASAGLRVLDTFGGFDSCELSRDSRRLIVLAEKP